jgi:Spy/CpxP family protein refolding chaperone
MTSNPGGAMRPLLAATMILMLAGWALAACQADPSDAPVAWWRPDPTQQGGGGGGAGGGGM